MDNNLIERASSFILLLAASLGLRKGEILGLHWEDIDFKQGILHVRRTVSYIPPHDGAQHSLEMDPKTAASRRAIVLPTFMLEMLKVHRSLQVQDQLFPCVENATKLLLIEIRSNHKKIA